MRQTGGVCRIVFAAGTYGYFCVEARLFTVLSQVHLQAVVQFKNVRIQRISRVGRVQARVTGRRLRRGRCVSAVGDWVGLFCRAAGHQQRRQQQYAADAAPHRGQHHH